ncbi:MAG: three-Cys-motif partner protein TcmP [Acidobacteria bacterium]|nr:three-Cys-motif partner protein TcmP [Acidobacteriota bacterium]
MHEPRFLLAALFTGRVICHLLKHMYQPLFEPQEDGLEIPEVGSWAETKYRLVGLYDKLFSTGMKDRWETRVYIDLYAGAGYSRIRGKNRLLAGSPFLALSVPDPFDKYIFCESSSPLLEALKKRVRKHFPKADAKFVLGDCNDKVEEIVVHPSKTRQVVSV